MASLEELHKYKVWCNTDKRWEETDYRSELPTACPVNNTHDIDIDSITVISTIKTGLTTIREVEEGTQAIYKLYAVNMTCPGNTITTEQFSFPYPVRVYDMSVLAGSDNINDFFEVYSPYEVNLGPASYITEDVSSSGTQLKVGSTLMALLRIGFILQISDGTNTEELGEILTLTSDTVTFTNALVNNYLVSNNAHVIFSNKRISKCRIRSSGAFLIGSGKIGGTLLPAGTPIMIKYYNETADQKYFTGTFGMDF